MGYLAPMEGHCQWAWPMPQYLSSLLLRWLYKELLTTVIFFFFFKSYVHCLYGTRNDMHL